MKQFRWLTALVVGAFLMAACGGMQAAVPSELELASVTTNPRVITPHQSGNAVAECAAVGVFKYAYKIDGWKAGTMNGTYTSQGVTFTITNDDATTKTFDWSATAPISAVIVKGGPGANLWSYDPPVTSDTGLYAPPNAEVSHVTFCWNDDDGTGLFGALAVSKTAITSYTRTHDWSIEKSVDPEALYLYVDGTGDAEAIWTVDVTYEGFTDSDFAVSGVITIQNVGTLAAKIDSVVDALEYVPADQSGDFNAILPIRCEDELGSPVTFDRPFDLPVGATLTCDYDFDFTDKASGTNTVTVKGEFSGDVPFDESDTVDVLFDSPDTEFPTDVTEVNAMVNVVDVSPLFNDGAMYRLGRLNAADFNEDDVTTFRYRRLFKYEDYGDTDCGAHTYDNTASVLNDAREVLDSADATLDVYVQCLVFKGESVTGAGLPWSAIRGAPNTWFEYTPYPIDVSRTYTTDLIQGRQRNDVGDVTITLERGGGAKLCFYLADDWELDESKSDNVKIQPLAVEPARYMQPGRFSEKFTEEGSEFCVTVPQGAYGYAIHLDAGYWMPDPDFGPN